jgi:transcriptional regulator with XRE-family HTH domain
MIATEQIDSASRTTNNARNTLGKKIKRQRLKKSLTLCELSAMSGVSPSHLGRIEKGERYPSATILKRIAEPLGYSDGELFTIAGFLSPEYLNPSSERKKSHNDNIDPSVSRVLSRETPEIQRAVIDILAILKNMSINRLSPDGNGGHRKRRPTETAPNRPLLPLHQWNYARQKR